MAEGKKNRGKLSERELQDIADEIEDPFRRLAAKILVTAAVDLMKASKSPDTWEGRGIRERVSEYFHGELYAATCERDGEEFMEKIEGAADRVVEGKPGLKTLAELHDVKPPKAPTQYERLESEEQEVRELAKEGKNINQIAKKLGVCHDAVGRFAKDKGIEVNRPYKKRKKSA